MPRRARRRKVDVPGYYVGGKTGTAEKVVNGRYSKTKLLTTFMAVMPADKPRYLITILLDEPQGLPETHGYRDLRLERGADGRQDHRARRADARAGTAARSAAGRSARSWRASKQARGRAFAAETNIRAESGAGRAT